MKSNNQGIEFYPLVAKDDSSGNVFVAGYRNYRIQKFTIYTPIITELGSYGTGG